MKRIILVLVFIVNIPVLAQTGGDRVVRNDPSNYRSLSAVHAGAGDMGFTQLIGRNDLNSNFLYLHAGTINGESGIGHHFHHSIEEMYVLLSGEAEFTINGRTSVLKAPVVVPCKLGDAHAVYNASDEPVQWLNFAVSQTKGRGDAFDLGDDRVGATKDPQPVFVSGKLDPAGLRDQNHPYAENGVLFKRVLGPEIFSTNWNYVDNLVIPSGKSLGTLKVGNLEAVYYVLGGSGTLKLNGESHPIGKDDAFAALMGETIEIQNDGNEELNLLAIGISIAEENSTKQGEPVAIALQMDFLVAPENREAFEDMYHSIYVPAMTVQEGYRGSKLLRVFPEAVSSEIQAEPTDYNYSVQIFFDTEQSRRNWVASDQHKIAWPAAEKLVEKYRWRGYDIMGEDQR